MNAILDPETPIGSHYFHMAVDIIAIPVKGVKQEAGMSIMLKGLSNFSLLPVIDKQKRLVGVIREQDVLLSPELGQNGLREAEALITLRKTDTIEQAIEKFRQTPQSLIPILDEQDRYIGMCASKSQLLRLLHGMLRPQRIGGLATPLGVYMTSGHYVTGSGWKGLMSVGLLFGIGSYLLSWLFMVAESALIAVVPSSLNWHFVEWDILRQGFFVVSMLGMLRLSPMAALHAAEHMTINAMENDLELTEASVRTQPREHARCGTNLLVLLTGLLLLGATYPLMLERLNWVGSTLYLLIWALGLAKIWFPSGLWLQRYFTTKDPNSAELASGIKAGQELLDKFALKPHTNPGFFRKLWGSGLLLTLVTSITSFTLCAIVVDWAGSGFNPEALLKWDFSILFQ